MNLKGMEGRLPPHRFARIHNSYIVPLEKITAVQRAQVFIGEEVIPVGEKFYPAFIKQYKP
jgi:DNA-binding LytR/AlgR family response regulator